MYRCFQCKHVFTHGSLVFNTVSIVKCPNCATGNFTELAEKRYNIATPMETFDTGAKRDNKDDKLDFEGHLSPLVLEALVEYMHFNRTLADGSLRDSDNWQKGIPRDSYMKSGWRHCFDWWKEHRGLLTAEGIVFALCGLLFNVQGYLHEYLKANPDALVKALEDATERRQVAKVKRVMSSDIFEKEETNE